MLSPCIFKVPILKQFKGLQREREDVLGLIYKTSEVQKRKDYTVGYNRFDMKFTVLFTDLYPTHQPFP